MRRIGSDTGGTFTDLVAADGRVAKLPSTPHDPVEAVRDGLRLLSSSNREGLDEFTHGTTVATNTLLERKGAAVALVTNEGFADLIEIARQDRPSLYDPRADRPEPLVPREWRYEVRGRLDPRGRELVPVDVASLPPFDPVIEAVAVCLLHSDLNPAHEQAVAGELRARGYDVTASHELSPEFREYERTVTTVLNAYLRPSCRSYVADLVSLAPKVGVLSSAGGLVPASVAAEQPARLLLSGPAGGVAAAAAVAAACGFPDAVTFDMGGTSTDVCLVLGGRPEPVAERSVAGFAVRLPALGVHTIGAGGGSIARIDPGGALVVGPRSAGAVPGPACYGRGGAEPTVTDADLVLGRIPADEPLPGLGRLDRAAAQAALDRAGLTAGGVIAVVDAHMEEALRVVSVARGVDPRSLALVAFGGAGPLHACALADALGMPVVIVPPRAGVLSAVGVLTAARQVDLVRSWADPLDHTGAAAALEQLAAAAAAEAGEPATIEARFDCRYQGQSHELRVGEVQDFHDVHERYNGYARRDQPVEVVALRATARVAAPVVVEELPVVHRERVVGPAVIAEEDCTIWVPDGWRAEPHETGALVLRRSGDSSPEGAPGTLRR
ncbi:MAG: hydantoinase/oxoprolinase family protein [Acidimicrobiales bacterium]|nr:hydantoinase/oxoprolinase family protein [Acidimicrobiales bacterium]